jgi:hypothetical protein
LNYGGPSFFPNTVASEYKALHVAIDGTFGPFVAAADARDVGSNVIRFSDGTCTVMIAFSVG